MIYLEQLFADKKLNLGRLIAYGFSAEEHSFTYKKKIMNDDFELIMSVDKYEVFDYSVIDLMTGDEYVLVKTGVYGGFVGQVSEACKEIILDVIDKCYDDDVFKSEQAKMLIGFMHDLFKVSADFPWKKSSPGNAVFRHPETGKWFAFIMKVDYSKLCEDKSGEIELICLKARPEKVKNLIVANKAYPAYHMSKEHWHSVVLDGNMQEDEELLWNLIESYYLTLPRSSRKIKKNV